jgi:hypothetical protein
MKIITILLLLVSAFQAKPAPQPQWKIYLSPEGRFSVLLPNKPTEVNNGTELRCKLVDGPNTYAIARTGSLQQGHNADSSLDATAEEFVKISKGKLLNKSTVSLEGIPGVAVRFETPEPAGITEARYFQIGKELYILFAVTYKGGSEENAKKFLNSFKLTK